MGIRGQQKSLSGTESFFDGCGYRSVWVAKAQREENMVEIFEPKPTVRDGGKDDQGIGCEVCGQPRERHRRKDGSWYRYKKCRRCRRLPDHKHLLGKTVTDERLASLIFALYLHLIELKKEKWKRTPKMQAVRGVALLLDILKED
jgi:hypothetical protein